MVPTNHVKRYSYLESVLKYEFKYVNVTTKIRKKNVNAIQITKKVTVRM